MPVKLRTHADFQKYNFFRTPSWRWDRVLALLDRDDGGPPGRCSRRDDDVVRAARGFVLRWRNGDVEARQRLLFERPDLFYAYDFHQRLDDDPDAAMYIQARLLARQTPVQIGETMGVLPEAVERYAELFFDVIPYLDNRDWVTKQVLIPALFRSPTIDDATGVAHGSHVTVRPFMDGSLKMFAYFGGPHLVDLMIAGMQAGRPLASPDDVSGWFDANVATTVRRRAAQAAQLFEINKYNVMELFAVHAKIMEIERSEESQDRSKSTQERHIKAMMDEIPWAVGDDGARLYGKTAVGRFDAMAAELRDDELILISSGRTAPTVAAAFPAALPPPRRVKTATATGDDTTLP